MNKEHGAVQKRWIKHSPRGTQILLSSRERLHYREHKCGSLLLIAEVYIKDKMQRNESLLQNKATRFAVKSVHTSARPTAHLWPPPLP